MSRISNAFRRKGVVLGLTCLGGPRGAEVRRQDQGDHGREGEDHPEEAGGRQETAGQDQEGDHAAGGGDKGRGETAQEEPGPGK